MNIIHVLYIKGSRTVFSRPSIRAMAVERPRWRWVVFVCSILAHIPCGFALGCLQYFYDELLKKFQESAAVTAGPVSLFLSFGCLTAGK